MDQEDTLTNAEEQAILEACRVLKSLHVDPVRFLHQVLEAEKKTTPYIPVETESLQGRQIPVRQIDERRIGDVLQTLCGDAGADALRAPSILEYLCSLRAARSYLGRDAEEKLGLGDALDRLSRAIALRSPRGRPIIPKEAELQDRIDYGVYTRIRATLAKEIGGRLPTLGKLGKFALFELAFTREQFEPFFTQQLAALRSKAKHRSVPLSHRAALVLLGLARVRRLDPTPITDDALEEALSNIDRLKKSLARISARSPSTRIPPTPTT